jgi:hypothetical protein
MKMGIKLKVGASPIQLQDTSCWLLFNSHLLEHIPHFKIDAVLAEFSRVLEIGGTVRILCPDLRKIATAYVNRDAEFIKEAVDEDENMRTDLGIGGIFMNFIVSPGQDTVLLNRAMTEFIGGYAHLYSYDFEMLEILLKKHGFGKICQKKFCESEIPDFQEPLHVVGFPKKWQNFNKSFYSENNLIHEYKDGKYNINFKVTGFDRDPLTSLIIEAKKEVHINNTNKNDQGPENAKNYNRYGKSLLFDPHVKSQLLKLGIKT